MCFRRRNHEGEKELVSITVERIFPKLQVYFQCLEVKMLLSIAVLPYECKYLIPQKLSTRFLKCDFNKKIFLFKWVV